MMNNVMISVKNLKKFFGDVKAVTTTIKLLLGLLESDEGELEVLGMDPEKDEIQIKTRIGYVSEEPLIFKSLTPKDLFNFIASIRGMDSEETTEKAQQYLESLGALDYYNQLIATLSHGNKQKIQIIAAILHEPDLLILDEPLAGLDAKSVKVMKEIIDMHLEKGGSVLFSTHIMEIAEELCDRIGIINRGKMVGIGTIDELRAQSDKVGARLEDVFLRLTEQDVSVKEIVKKLRKSFKNKN
ncbi:MAG: ABC transporter ATP-binding protein [Promethearchaeota archaeon]